MSQRRIGLLPKYCRVRKSAGPTKGLVGRTCPNGHALLIRKFAKSFFCPKCDARYASRPKSESRKELLRAKRRRKKKKAQNKPASPIVNRNVEGIVRTEVRKARGEI